MDSIHGIFLCCSFPFPFDVSLFINILTSSVKTDVVRILLALLLFYFFSKKRFLDSKLTCIGLLKKNFLSLLLFSNFGMIPLQYRVLYNNMLSLFWNAYLSNVNSRNIKNDGKGSNVIDVDGEELRSKVNDVSSVVSPSTRQQQQKQQRSEMKSSLMRLTCYLIILSLITEYLSLGKHSSE